MQWLEEMDILDMIVDKFSSSVSYIRQATRIPCTDFFTFVFLMRVDVYWNFLSFLVMDPLMWASYLSSHSM